MGAAETDNACTLANHEHQQKHYAHTAPHRQTACTHTRTHSHVKLTCQLLVNVKVTVLHHMAALVVREVLAGAHLMQYDKHTRWGASTDTC